jgi:hypothetical protein
MAAFSASQLVGRFVASIQKPSGPPPAPISEWVTLRDGKIERASRVTRSLLRELLPKQAFWLWADEMRDAPRAARSLAVLRRRGPFVALVSSCREFSKLIDRRALLEELVTHMDD